MRASAEYLALARSSLSVLRTQLSAIEQAAELIADTWLGRGSVYTMGNGAGVALAEHFACDLVKWSRPGERPGIQVHPLTSGPLLTAIANDIGYDSVFAAQLRWLRPSRKDVAVAFSCSGASNNIVNALSYMRNLLRTVLITGSPDAPGLKYADVGIVCQGYDYRVQEDMFSVVAHNIVGLVQDRLLIKAKEYGAVDHGSDPN